MIIQNIYKNKSANYFNKYYIIPVIYLLVAIPYSYFMNVWIDDTYSLQTTSIDLAYTIKQSIGFESQPPLYFILLYFWRLIHPSIFFARFLNIILILITLLIIPKISRKQIPNLDPIWFQLIVLMHPVTLWVTTEIRCFAMVVFLSALLTYFYQEAYLSESGKKINRVLYIITALTGLFTQYYFAFLLVSYAIPFLIYRNWKVLKRYIFDMIIPVVSVGILIPLLLSQIVTYENLGKEKPFTLIETLRYLRRIFEGHVLSLESLGFESTPIYKYIIRIIFLTGFVLLYKASLHRFYNKIRQPHTFTLPLLSIIILFFMLSFFIGQQYLYYKYTLIAFIPVWIFWLNIIVDERKKYLLYMNLAVFAYSIFVVFNSPFAKINDYKSIAKYIEAAEHPEQPLLIYRNELVPPFEYYYNGINNIIAIPHRIDYNQPYDHALWALKTPEQIQSFFTSVEKEHSSFWLVSDSVPQIYGIPYNYEILEDYINQHYEVKQSKRYFDHVTIRLLIKK